MSLLKNKEFQLKALGIAIFAFCSILISYPSLQGKILNQHDIKMSRGSSSEVTKYREQGRQILWTNALFSGMPANLISVKNDSELVKYIPVAFMIFPKPINIIFLLMIGFFILLLSLNVKTRIAIIGGLAYGLSSYYLVYLVAGHNTKVHALAYLPGILAGLIWLYRDKKIFLGLGVFTLFFALEIQARHPQMLYYMLFTLGFYFIFQLLEYIKKKEILSFLKLSLFAAIALCISIASSYSYLSNTMGYGEKSIRGKSELTIGVDNKTESGLDAGYITNWSYGISESMSLLIPNWKGGETKAIGADNKALDVLSNPNFKQSIAGQNHYWGQQPIISGPAYAGAIVFFLAFLGMFFVDRKIKYVLIVGILFSLALAWGKNFPAMTDWFIENFPYYSKFRAVSSFIVIPLLLIPALAMLTLNKLASDNIWTGETKLFGKIFPNKKVIWAGYGMVLAFCLISYVAPGLVNSFLSNQEAETLPGQLSQAGFNAQQASTFIQSFEDVRKEIFKADVLRTIGFLAIGGLLLWLYSRKSLSQNLFITLTGVLIFVDSFSIDRRYMNEDNFVNKKSIENNYGIVPSAADRQILQDPDPHYRVLNLTVSPFNDATTSFLHKSIGGYHGAKMKIYQDFIENQISPDLTKIQQGFQAQGAPSQVFASTNALNMLNAKYLIVSANQAIRNPAALGNAWFVEELKMAKTADEEIQMVGEISPAKEVVIRENFAKDLSSYSFAKDSTASINLLSYDPELMVYESNNSKPGLAVFSEVYYPENWRAYIDNEEQQVIRANYVLRALKIPAGKHKIEFKYIDERYESSATVSWIGSLLVLVGVPIFLFLSYKKERE
tara:strand:- start:162036 stop:164552 length:2517 start_codon:yes stop_codon:yes gene_type:complete